MKFTHGEQLRENFVFVVVCSNVLQVQVSKGLQLHCKETKAHGPYPGVQCTRPHININHKRQFSRSYPIISPAVGQNPLPSVCTCLQINSVYCAIACRRM